MEFEDFAARDDESSRSTLSVTTAETSPVAPLLDLVEGERAKVLGFLRRRVGPDAEDVLQQSLIRALEHADAVRDPALARAWFWRIVRNAAADHHAAEVARDARHAAHGASLSTTTDEAAAACACALGLLPKLPPAYADILRRVDIDDARVVDVATELGISADNAAVRLHRARKALRERLRGCCRVESMRACFACECPDERHAD